jgi:NAD(P)-dependent dehydrogenase (short-subunit alcohol dehydrogenase family)
MSPITRIGGPDAGRGTQAEYLSPGRFDGKVALVTGAGSGIGRATAIRLAAEGAVVACLEVNEENLESTVKAIAADERSGHGSARAYHCDVTSEDSVGTAVAAATADLGPITVVCNVAGIGGFANAEEQSMEGWNRMIAVNLTGTFLICRATLPNLLVHGGSITNVVSTAGMMGQPYSAAYCASKGGVHLMTKALAVEFVDRGIRVNGVAPGCVDTPMIHDFGYPKDANPKAMDRIMSEMGFCTPAEIASAIAFIASDEAGYISGAILSVDGALTS